MDAFPQNTWNDLRGELAKRFSDVNDSQYALSLLRSVRQKVGENIQIYAERILSLAEEAFAGQGGNAVERQLIDTFVDGLVNNDQLKMKILRDNPDTLQGAISIATKEQNLRARVNLSSSFHPPYKSERREELMEVDHYRPVKCFKCRKTGHTKKNCKNVNSVDDKTGASDIKRFKGRCWGCGKEGHILKFCRQNDRQTERPNIGHGQRRTEQGPASVAQLDAPSDWRPGGRGFNPRRGRQHSFVEIDHEIFSTVILSLPLIQEGQLSVSGERMCTILVNRLED